MENRCYEKCESNQKKNKVAQKNQATDVAAIHEKMKKSLRGQKYN